jgi:cobalt-zinc-cadmium efflux system protein
VVLEVVYGLLSNSVALFADAGHNISDVLGLCVAWAAAAGPGVSLIINAIIVWGTWGLLRDSVTMSLNAVPADLESQKVRAFLCETTGVQEMHDLRISSMSTTETALTCTFGYAGRPSCDSFFG